MIKLVKPQKKFLSTVKKGIKEYQTDTASFRIQSVQMMIDAMADNFATYFQRLYEEENGINLLPTYVKQTVFWIMKNDKYIGTIALRHELNPDLEKIGGHIGYQIIPSERNKGYAKEALRLCVKEGAKMGIDKTLVTCSENNLASYKAMCAIMKETGGYEIDMSETKEGKNHRVWLMTGAKDYN